jgi:CBS domain-containing protein
MKAAMRVEDLMTTAVVMLHANDTVGRVKAEMSFAQIRHIPVVDEKHRVVGIISDRDLHRAAGKSQGPRRVGEIMTRPARTVHPTTPAHQAAALMLELKIGSLPVVNEREELVGVITETDFLSVAHQALRGLMPAERGQS